MKKNEMLNALYRHHISRLLKKPLPAFPSDDLKERLEKTCTKFSSRFITTAREAMWEEFNKIWTDENITKSIIDALGITSDFCSWFLFYLQQAVAKTYLQCDSTAVVNDLDLSDAEQESAAYIAGAVLKNVGSKLCEHDDPHDSKTSGICKLSLHLQERNRANRIINYRYEMSSVRTKLPTHSMRSRN